MQSINKMMHLTRTHIGERMYKCCKDGRFVLYRDWLKKLFG